MVYLHEDNSTDTLSYVLRAEDKVHCSPFMLTQQCFVGAARASIHGRNERIFTEELDKDPFGTTGAVDKQNCSAAMRAELKHGSGIGGMFFVPKA
jgi:hypothetical protein